MKKRNRTSKTIKGTLLFASVAEENKGIILRVETEEQRIEICLLPVGERIGDISLVIPEGMDAQKEMQKVCDLLNGMRENDSGEMILNPNHIPKQITIVNE